MLYDTYVEQGLLGKDLTFIIPIYDNMPAANKLPTSLTKEDGDLHFVSVKATPLTLRAEPSNSSAYLTSMVKDTVVAVLEKNVNGTKFHKVKLGSGMIGYASSEYLTSCTTLIDKPVFKDAVIKDKDGNIIETEGTTIGTGSTITIGEKTHTVVKLGDTTGDGNLTPLDYVKIKNNIMKTTKLEGCYKLAGDTTGDGDITPLDYVKVKNNIMKISKITLSE